VVCQALKERDRDASSCMRRHQAFALAPVPWKEVANAEAAALRRNAQVERVEEAEKAAMEKVHSLSRGERRQVGDIAETERIVLRKNERNAESGSRRGGCAYTEWAEGVIEEREV